jgi:hypothetical protein
MICTRDSYLNKPPLDEAWKARLLAATERRRSETLLNQAITFGTLILASTICIVGIFRAPSLVALPPQKAADADLPAALIVKPTNVVVRQAAVPAQKVENRAGNQAVKGALVVSRGQEVTPLFSERAEQSDGAEAVPGSGQAPPAVKPAESATEAENLEMLEPTAAWWLRWDFKNLEGHAKAEMHESFDSNRFVLETHPPQMNQPLILSSKLLVPENRPFLEFAVRATEGGEFNLIAEVEGKCILARTVRGAGWQSFALDLRPLRRKEILVSLQHVSSVWEKAGAYWQAPIFASTASNLDTVVSLDKEPGSSGDVSQAEMASLLNNLGLKPKAGPARFADAKLEYERTISETYALLQSRGSAAAIARLEQGRADAQLAPLHKKLARDVECLRFLDDTAVAGLQGALRLANHPDYTLRWSDGQLLHVGTATPNALTSVKDGELEITQALPEGQAIKRVPFSKLAPQVRYELAAKGLPDTPEGHLKLAMAGIVMWHNGEGEVTTKDIRANLDRAAKSQELAELAPHVAGILEFLERELNAEARFQIIQKRLEERQWPELLQLIESFRADFLNTYALALREKALDEYAAQIPRPFLGKL